MGSTNKTANYGLNQWQGNEYPKRQDFVDDNAAIDAELKKAQNHRENMANPHGVTAQQLALTSPTSLTLYVSPSGSDDNNGLTAETPFLTVQKALSLGNLWTSLNIKLADGTYNIGDISLNRAEILFEGISQDSSKCILNGSILTDRGFIYLHYITCNGVNNVDMVSVWHGKVLVADSVINSKTNGVTLHDCAEGVVTRSAVNNSTGVAIISNNACVMRCISLSGTGNHQAFSAGGGIIISDGTKPSSTASDTTSGGGMILNDGIIHESGVWAPVIKIGGVENTTGERSGKYFRIGNWVLLYYWINLYGTGMGTGTCCGILNL